VLFQLPGQVSCVAIRKRKWEVYFKHQLGGTQFFIKCLSRIKNMESVMLSRYCIIQGILMFSFKEELNLHLTKFN